MHIPIATSVAAAILAMAFAAPVDAQKLTGAGQTQELKRTPLQTFDVPAGSYQTVIGTSELPANSKSGRQSHPGPEGGYVLQGSGSILVDGKPPMMLKAGQSYQLPPRVIHEVSSGPKGVKLLVVWVVEKGQPFASPAK